VALNLFELYLRAGVAFAARDAALSMHGYELVMMVRSLNAKAAPVFQAKAVGTSGTSFFGR